MRRQPQSDEVESDLRAGEMGLALLAAATFYFGGWLGLFPALWFLWSITDARVTPEQRRQLVAPAQTTWRYLRRGELPEGTPRWAQKALGGYVPRGELPAPAAGGEGAATADEGAADPLFAALEQRPHRLFIGYTGGGKTTLMHHLATGWAKQGQPVYVCDPDAAPGVWPGCIVVGGGDDYGAIAERLTEVGNEFGRRSQARAQGRRKFSPMHLVIDEVQETIAHVPEAWDVLEPVIRRGRKLGMHVTLGVQDDQVETLDLDGKSHLLRNLVTTELYIDERGQRTARIKGRTASQTSTFPVPQLLDPESLIVEYQAPAPAPAAPAMGTTTQLRRAVAADAPRGEVVSVRVPERQAARAAAPDPLLASLMAELPAEVRAQVPDLSPERAERLARILGGQQTLTIDTSDPLQLKISMGQLVVTPPAEPAAPKPERKVLTPAQLAARREWANYYKRAARAKPPIPFDRAYQAAPVKGNRNRAHAIYKAALPDTAS